MIIFRTPQMEQTIGTIPSRTLSLLLDFPGWSGRVLDLGCGDGSFDYRAFPHASVVEVDRTLTLLDKGGCSSSKSANRPGNLLRWIGEGV